MVERSCRACKYDSEMYEQNFCTLHSGIVKEFATEHLGFPDDFKILNNWFMGHEPCDYWVAKDDVSKAYGARARVSSFDVICPDCGGTMEMRRFKDGEDPDGNNVDINRDWWCPACKLRWMAVNGSPMEAGIL